MVCTLTPCNYFLVGVVMPHCMMLLVRSKRTEWRASSLVRLASIYIWYAYIACSCVGGWVWFQCTCIKSLKITTVLVVGHYYVISLLFASSLTLTTQLIDTRLIIYSQPKATFSDSIPVYDKSSGRQTSPAGDTKMTRGRV